MVLQALEAFQVVPEVLRALEALAAYRVELVVRHPLVALVALVA